ncbi:maleylpyruvate isomerase N-terminal domain-containing protein [Microlunatus flavus]|uniref:TIGR03083 family protein n=1 Tax=Microlunatus flavus TaxID=1036181 RepID=A0A1H8ZVZ5_9ACTN|nr:maleylpyruvate isomerase N-terminal domain-containing protein [Microlunatus flavus]SEP67928.1 TIGR03083 family protein [Microlunatus flavus]
MSGWEGPAAPVLEAFEAATGAFVDLVGRVDGGWDRPGLGRWDLRALVGHTARALVTVTTYLDRPAQQEDLPTAAAYLRGAGKSDGDAVFARGVSAGQELGDDPYAWVSTTADRAVTRVRAADPSTLVETIGGGMRLVSYLPTRTFELVVHSLDVAGALGLDPDVPAAALRETATLATAAVLDQGRGTDLLLTLTGRADWPADLVVVR